MKRIILLILFLSQNSLAEVNNVTINPNESLLLAVDSKLVRVHCAQKTSSPKPEPPAAGNCKFEPTWNSSGAFIGFYILIGDMIWKKYELSDYNNNRKTAYIYAKRELNSIRFDGLCSRN